MPNGRKSRVASRDTRALAQRFDKKTAGNPVPVPWPVTQNPVQVARPRCTVDKILYGHAVDHPLRVVYSESFTPSRLPGPFWSNLDSGRPQAAATCMSYVVYTGSNREFRCLDWQVCYLIYMYVCMYISSQLLCSFALLLFCSSVLLSFCSSALRTYTNTEWCVSSSWTQGDFHSGCALSGP